MDAYYSPCEVAWLAGSSPVVLSCQQQDQTSRHQLTLSVFSVIFLCSVLEKRAFSPRGEEKVTSSLEFGKAARSPGR